MGTVVGIIAALCSDISFFGNDAAQYLSAARNLIAGNGFATDLLYYDVHYGLDTYPAPQTVFPPGFSYLIALFGYIGGSPEKGLMLANAVALGSLPVLVYVGSATVTDNFRFVVTIAAAHAGIVVFYSNSIVGNSEMIFTALTLVAMIFIGLAEQERGSRYRWLALSGIACAGAISVRYQGVFLLISVASVLGIRWLLDIRRQSFFQLLTFLAVPMLVLAALFGRNYLYTGGLFGGPITGAESTSTAISVLQTMYWQVSQIVGLSLEGLTQFRMSELCFIALIVSLLGFLVRHGMPTVNLSRLRFSGKQQIPLLVKCAAVYVGVSLLIFVWLSATKSIAYMQERYLMTLLPHLAIVISWFAGKLKIENDCRSVWTVLVIVFLLFTTVLGQVNVFVDQRAKLSAYSSSFEIIERSVGAKFPTESGESVRDLLAAEAAFDRPVFSFESQRIGMILRSGALGAAPSRYSGMVFGQHTVACILNRYNTRYLMTYPTLFEYTEVRNSNRDLFRQLKENRLPSWLVIAARSEEFVLYRVTGSPRCETVDETREIEL